MGAEVITEILNKEGGSHAIYMVCRGGGGGGGLTEILSFPTYFSLPPPPLYINNDRSLTLIYFEWRDTENQHSTSKEIRIRLNGYTIGFCPQTLKLESLHKSSIFH